MTRPDRCSESGNCPSATLLDDGRWLIVGMQITDAAARELGGSPSYDEGAVLVPGEVIEDAVAGPLRARITELEAADRDAERVLTERIVARLLRIAEAQTDEDEHIQAFRAGLLAAAGEAKAERLFEPEP